MPFRCRLWINTELVIQHLCVLGICAVLLGAFWVQFAQGEYPCPLCLLQRMAMILAAIGSIFIITHRHRPHVSGFSVNGMGYGMSVLAALLGAIISGRQVLLHIEPGEPGYGSPMFGMHLYTWALVVFMCVVLVSGVMLIFGRDRQWHAAERFDSASDNPTATFVRRLPWYTKVTFWIFGVIIFANVLSAFAEAGFNAFLPDNPTSYKLFEGTAKE